MGSSVNVQNASSYLEKLQLGALTLASTAVLSLILSDKFPAGEALNFVVLGFMAACGFLWNGFLFGNIYLGFSGIALCLLSFNALVAAMLPIPFSCASWIFSIFCIIPFLYLLIKPPTAPPAVIPEAAGSLQHEFVADS